MSLFISALKQMCDIPIVQTNVIIELIQNFTIGSVVAYYCKDHNSSATSICSEGGKWIPDPAEYSCEAIPDSKGTNNYIMYR